MLKEAKYRCWGVGDEFPEYNKVAYLIIGRNCYFTGIEKNHRTSTINAAESIIQSIATQEGVNVFELRFFDLQTYAGGYNYFPGQFVLDELIIHYTPGRKRPPGLTVINVDDEMAVLLTQADEDFVVRQWSPTPCPANVIEHFRAYIGKVLELSNYTPASSRFHDGRLTVVDKSGKYFHIREDGTPAYSERYSYAADFNNGLAWVSKDNFLYAKIDRDGKLLSDWIACNKLQ